MQGRGTKHNKRSVKKGSRKKKRSSQKDHRKLMVEHARKRSADEAMRLARQKARRAKFIKQVQSGEFGIPKIKEDTKDNE